MQNATYVLSEEQTGEFRNLWKGHRRSLKSQDFNFVWMKLNRNRAVITKNQVFRAVMTLTETGFNEQLPEWLLQLIDPQNDGDTPRTISSSTTEETNHEYQ